jgi:hypothetical protein
LIALPPVVVVPVPEESQWRSPDIFQGLGFFSLLIIVEIAIKNRKYLSFPFNEVAR